MVVIVVVVVVVTVVVVLVFVLVLISVIIFLFKPLTSSSHSSVFWLLLFPCPNNWNSLPDSVRSSDTFNSFQWHLKTHLFSSSFQYS